MKNTTVKNSIVLLVLALSGLSAAEAQNKVLYTQTDAVYANTTIAYKNGNAQDADILNELDDSMVMGDVVRISTPPPAPKVEQKPMAQPASIQKKGLPSTVKQVAKPAKRPVNRAVAPAEAAKAVTPDLTVPIPVQEVEIAAPEAVTRTKSYSGTQKTTAKKSSAKRHKAKKNLKFQIFPKRKYKAKGKQKYTCPKW